MHKGFVFDEKLISIGASEIAQFMGKIPNKTAEGAVYKKIAKLVGGRVSGDGYISAEILWGVENEQSALDLFNFEIDACFVKPETKYLPNLILHASPDGFCENRKQVVEIKCPNSDTYIKYVTNIKDAQTLKEVCPEYYWQMQLQMYVFDTNSGYFVAYDPRVHCMPIFYTLIERNEQDIQEMVEKATYWYNFATKIIKNLGL